jgi:thiol-disulfide isomerase/thioredoxin
MIRVFILQVLMIGCTAVASAQSIKKVKATDVRMMMDTGSVPLIVNFWATWCAPCVKEIPWFDSIMTEKNSGAKLLLVSLDFPESYPGKLTSFVTKHGYKGDVVFLDETDADYFCPVLEKQWDGSIPSTIFINNKENYKHFIGSQISRQQFARELDELAEKKDSNFLVSKSFLLICFFILIAATAFLLFKKRSRPTEPGN